MPSDKVGYEVEAGVARIVMDDGKANAVSHEVIEALQDALQRAESEKVAAVVLGGRPGRLSGGFDLSVMTSGPEAARALVAAGAELMLRLYTFPRPVVVACSGHAIAAGAILLLTADARIGARGSFKIGLNEVAINLALPIFAMELARDRLSKRHFTAAVTQARLYDPETALDAGYLDAVVAPEEVFSTAIEHAHRLGALPEPAFRSTKTHEREATVQHIRATLDANLRTLTGA